MRKYGKSFVVTEPLPSIHTMKMKKLCKRLDKRRRNIPAKYVLFLADIFLCSKPQ